MGEKKTYVIDGHRFTNLDEFYDEISQMMLPETFWGRNLDAFNDILRGNFGPIDDSDFVIIWKNSELSKQRLGYAETVKFLELIHNRRGHDKSRELEAAKKGEGDTIFDWLVNIILEKKHIELRLE